MFLASVSMFALKAVLLVAGYLAETLSLDFNAMIDIAFQIINALWPLFVVPMGFLFGLRLIGWIMDEIRVAIPGR
jgi:hypothetical protein